MFMTWPVINFRISRFYYMSCAPGALACNEGVIGLACSFTFILHDKYYLENARVRVYLSYFYG